MAQYLFVYVKNVTSAICRSPGPPSPQGCTSGLTSWPQRKWRSRAVGQARTAPEHGSCFCSSCPIILCLQNAGHTGVWMADSSLKLSSASQKTAGVPRCDSSHTPAFSQAQRPFLGAAPGGNVRPRPRDSFLTVFIAMGTDGAESSETPFVSAPQ